MAVKWEAEIGQIRMLYLKLAALIDGDSQPGDTETDTETLCHAYDKEGNLIWSSAHLSYESKCWLVFGLALPVMFFTRPKRR